MFHRVPCREPELWLWQVELGMLQHAHLHCDFILAGLAGMQVVHLRRTASDS